MEAGDLPQDVVHPEVRAHINSLVSALGGASADEDGHYKLGDDALEVLRDLKRWIRFYDEKTNRMDVARCLADANLIGGDLLPILALWPENATDSRFKSRVALACFELMVPLTWPLARDSENTTVNHHRHLPVLQLAQLAYKRVIINFDSARVLHAAVRVALPSMAVPIGDRTARDQGIIKLALFFLRNIAMIAPPPDVKYDGDETQISRSAIIDAFAYQDIFLFLLTIASNMGEDFRTEDVTVMEVIYHLVKLVDAEKLFMSEQQLNQSKTEELADMMNKETAMLKGYKKGMTRHNRFGTMVWVKREGSKVSTVSGQDALRDAATRQQKIDSSKTYRPPRKPRKKDGAGDLGPQPKLNARANDQLSSFVQDFLDSGFNPLFQHVRKTIDRDAPHLLGHHQRQFFYLVAWFLQAERIRRRLRKAAASRSRPAAATDDVGSFSLVAGVLNQEMFIAISRALHNSYDHKEWADLTAVMRCFTEILLTVQEMSESGNEEDEEIADNTLGRLFYEDATHDIIANIARTFKDQGFEYLDAATELAHHFLRILEAYSKQNVDMQVRSRKRQRRKRTAAKTADAQGSDDVEEDVNNGQDGDGSEDDQVHAERTTRERKFDFKKFSARFTPQGVVDTFVALTRYYRDLSDAQLKRAHRYFYRIAFKLDCAVMLYRVDIIHLFQAMIKGPEPLSRSSAVYQEWEELSKQVLRKCVRKIQERPHLVVEMLFSKTSSTVFFLEHGFNKPAVTPALKPAAELEFRGDPGGRDRQIAIVVGALLDKNGADLVGWLKRVLEKAEAERRGWESVHEAFAAGARAREGEEEVDARRREDEPGPGPEPEQTAPVPDSGPEVPPPFLVQAEDDACRWAMFKNSQLRLLMKLCDVVRLIPALDEVLDSTWSIASDITSAHLRDSIAFVNQAEFSPPVFDEGVLAEHQLRRKPAPRKRPAHDDDDGMDIVNDDDDDAFAPGGPTARKVVDGETRPKKTRRRRRAASEDGEEDLPGDSEVEEKRRKRREKEQEKARKVKSALYVVDDDDDEWDVEADTQFFAREEAIRRKAQQAAENVAADPTREPEIAAPMDQALLRYLGGYDDEEPVSAAAGRGHEQGEEEERGDDDDGDVNNNHDDDDDDLDMEDDGGANGVSGVSDTPLAASPGPSTRKGNARKRRRLSDESSVSRNGSTRAVSVARPPIERSADVDVDMTTGDDDGSGHGDSEDEDIAATVAVAARPRRPRIAVGFVDSDDE